MSKLLHKTLLAAGALLAACTLCAVPASAQTQPAAAAKKPVKAKARAKVAPAVAIPDEPEPDITDTTVTDYECELGNKIAIYHNEADNEHIALRWKKRLHRLKRVGTTTGARRFENPTYGLIWIGIPAKGMLLDAKLNRQLANECKSKEQLAPPVINVIEPALAVPAAAVPALVVPEAAVPVAPVMPPEAVPESKTK